MLLPWTAPPRGGARHCQNTLPPLLLCTAALCDDLNKRSPLGGGVFGRRREGALLMMQVLSEKDLARLLHSTCKEDPNNFHHPIIILADRLTCI